jgi:hypothetical protein
MEDTYREPPNLESHMGFEPNIRQSNSFGSSRISIVGRAV